MTYEILKKYLEIGYYISQIALVGVAIIAAWYAAAQTRIFRIHEMLKYIESKEAREARLIVMRDIQTKMDTDWWIAANDQDGSLSKNASDVAALYDVVYIMLNKESPAIKEIFYKNWADSIIKAHAILYNYLKYRREEQAHPNANAYMGFTKLAQEVRRYSSYVS